MNPSKKSDLVQVQCQINGKSYQFETYPMARLLDVIREQAQLTGTKEGCGEGECGACSILINGELINSCLVPVLQAQGTQIETIEGLADANSLSALQNAFIEGGGAQCGICTPGMIMESHCLLKKKPNATEAEIREGLAGNICRCTGYIKIFESLKSFQKSRGLS